MHVFVSSSRFRPLLDADTDALIDDVNQFLRHPVPVMSDDETDEDNDSDDDDDDKEAHDDHGNYHDNQQGGEDAHLPLHPRPSRRFGGRPAASLPYANNSNNNNTTTSTNSSMSAKGISRPSSRASLRSLASLASQTSHASHTSRASSSTGSFIRIARHKKRAVTMRRSHRSRQKKSHAKPIVIHLASSKQASKANQSASIAANKTNGGTAVDASMKSPSLKPRRLHAHVQHRRPGQAAALQAALLSPQVKTQIQRHHHQTQKLHPSKNHQNLLSSSVTHEAHATEMINGGINGDDGLELHLMLNCHNVAEVKQAMARQAGVVHLFRECESLREQAESLSSSSLLVALLTGMYFPSADTKNPASSSANGSPFSWASPLAWMGTSKQSRNQTTATSSVAGMQLPNSPSLMLALSHLFQLSPLAVSLQLLPWIGLESAVAAAAALIFVHKRQRPCGTQNSHRQHDRHHHHEQQQQQQQQQPSHHDTRKKFIYSDADEINQLRESNGKEVSNSPEKNNISSSKTAAAASSSATAALPPFMSRQIGFSDAMLSSSFMHLHKLNDQSFSSYLQNVNPAFSLKEELENVEKNTLPMLTSLRIRNREWQNMHASNDPDMPSPDSASPHDDEDQRNQLRRNKKSQKKPKFYISSGDTSPNSLHASNSQLGSPFLSQTIPTLHLPLVHVMGAPSSSSFSASSTAANTHSQQSPGDPDFNNHIINSNNNRNNAFCLSAASTSASKSFFSGINPALQRSQSIEYDVNLYENSLSDVSVLNGVDDDNKDDDDDEENYHIHDSEYDKSNIIENEKCKSDILNQSGCTSFDMADSSFLITSSISSPKSHAQSGDSSPSYHSQPSNSAASSSSSGISSSIQENNIGEFDSSSSDPMERNSDSRPLFVSSEPRDSNDGSAQSCADDQIGSHTKVRSHLSFPTYLPFMEETSHHQYQRRHQQPEKQHRREKSASPTSQAALNSSSQSASSKSSKSSHPPKKSKSMIEFVFGDESGGYLLRRAAPAAKNSDSDSSWEMMMENKNSLQHEASGASNSNGDKININIENNDDTADDDQVREIEWRHKRSGSQHSIAARRLAQQLEAMSSLSVSSSSTRSSPASPSSPAFPAAGGSSRNESQSTQQQVLSIRSSPLASSVVPELQRYESGSISTGALVATDPNGIMILPTVDSGDKNFNYSSNSSSSGGGGGGATRVFHSASFMASIERLLRDTSGATDAIADALHAAREVLISTRSPSFLSAVSGYIFRISQSSNEAYLVRADLFDWKNELVASDDGKEQTNSGPKDDDDDANIGGVRLRSPWLRWPLYLLAWTLNRVGSKGSSLLSPEIVWKLRV